MSWLAVWLMGVGLMDLVRAVDHRRARQWAAPVGVLTVLLVGLLCGLTGWGDLLALVLSLLPLMGWWWFAGKGLAAKGRHHVWALGSLAAGGVGLLALSGFARPAAGPLQRWLLWADLPLLHNQPMNRILLITGLLLLNLATGNLIVRLILVSVGAMRPTGVTSPGAQPADRLRGGRLLGPMERLVIVGLGLAGQVTAASLVIAAKGLLRFPELQSRSKDGAGVNGLNIDAITEYFLVGSFVSWLIALGSLALTR